MAPAGSGTLASSILPSTRAPPFGWCAVGICWVARDQGANQMERPLPLQASHAPIHTQGRHERSRGRHRAHSATAGARALELEADPTVAPLEHLGLQLLPRRLLVERVPMRNIPNLELHRQRLDQLGGSEWMRAATLAAGAGQIQPSRVWHTVEPSAHLRVASRWRWRRSRRRRSSSAGHHLQRVAAAGPQGALLVDEPQRPDSSGEPASSMAAAAATATATAEEGGYFPELGAGFGRL